MLISEGASFSVQNWGTFSWGYTAKPPVADFNADGLADVLGFSGSQNKLLLSTGSGFESIPVAKAADVVGDTNGDGAADFVSTYPSIAALESAGRSLVETPLSGGGHVYAAIDTNGDGRSDFPYSSCGVSYGTGEHDCSYGTLVRSGNQLLPIGAPVFPPGRDFNGDGKVDNSSKFDSVLPDLLKRHVLASGGTVDVEFLPSTYWSNGYLPMIVQAVSKVTTSDGRGNSSKTKYAYEGGAYDPFERKFLGFAKVTAELACETGETTCPWVHAWYRQEAVAAGAGTPASSNRVCW